MRCWESLCYNLVSDEEEIRYTAFFLSVMEQDNTNHKSNAKMSKYVAALHYTTVDGNT